MNEIQQMRDEIQRLRFVIAGLEESNFDLKLLMVTYEAEATHSANEKIKAKQTELNFKEQEIQRLKQELSNYAKKLKDITTATIMPTTTSTTATTATVSSTNGNNSNSGPINSSISFNLHTINNKNHEKSSPFKSNSNTTTSTALPYQSQNHTYDTTMPPYSQHIILSQHPENNMNNNNNNHNNSTNISNNMTVTVPITTTNPNPNTNVLDIKDDISLIKESSHKDKNTIKEIKGTNISNTYDHSIKKLHTDVNNIWHGEVLLVFYMMEQYISELLLFITHLRSTTRMNSSHTSSSRSRSRSSCSSSGSTDNVYSMISQVNEEIRCEIQSNRYQITSNRHVQDSKQDLKQHLSMISLVPLFIYMINLGIFLIEMGTIIDDFHTKSYDSNPHQHIFINNKNNNNNDYQYTYINKSFENDYITNRCHHSSLTASFQNTYISHIIEYIRILNQLISTLSSYDISLIQKSIYTTLSNDKNTTTTTAVSSSSTLSKAKPTTNIVSTQLNAKFDEVAKNTMKIQSNPDHLKISDTSVSNGSRSFHESTSRISSNIIETLNQYIANKSSMVLPYTYVLDSRLYHQSYHTNISTTNSSSTLNDQSLGINQSPRHLRDNNICNSIQKLFYILEEIMSILSIVHTDMKNICQVRIAAANILHCLFHTIGDNMLSDQSINFIITYVFSTNLLDDNNNNLYKDCLQTTEKDKVMSNLGKKDILTSDYKRRYENDDKNVSTIKKSISSSDKKQKLASHVIDLNTSTASTAATTPISPLIHPLGLEKRAFGPEFGTFANTKINHASMTPPNKVNTIYNVTIDNKKDDSCRQKRIRIPLLFDMLIGQLCDDIHVYNGNNNDEKNHSLSDLMNVHSSIIGNGNSSNCHNSGIDIWTTYILNDIQVVAYKSTTVTKRDKRQSLHVINPILYINDNKDNNISLVPISIYYAYMSSRRQIIQLLQTLLLSDTRVFQAFLSKQHLEDHSTVKKSSTSTTTTTAAAAAIISTNDLPSSRSVYSSMKSNASYKDSRTQLLNTLSSVTTGPSNCISSSNNKDNKLSIPVDVDVEIRAVCQVLGHYLALHVFHTPILASTTINNNNNNHNNDISSIHVAIYDMLSGNKMLTENHLSVIELFKFQLQICRFFTGLIHIYHADGVACILSWKLMTISPSHASTTDKDNNIHNNNNNNNKNSVNISAMKQLYTNTTSNTATTINDNNNNNNTSMNIDTNHMTTNTNTNTTPISSTRKHISSSSSGVNGKSTRSGHITTTNTTTSGITRTTTPTDKSMSTCIHTPLLVDMSKYESKSIGYTWISKLLNSWLNLGKQLHNLYSEYVDCVTLINKTEAFKDIMINNIFLYDSIYYNMFYSSQNVTHNTSSKYQKLSYLNDILCNKSILLSSSSSSSLTSIYYGYIIILLKSLFHEMTILLNSIVFYLPYNEWLHVTSECRSDLEVYLWLWSSETVPSYLRLKSEWTKNLLMDNREE